MFGRIDMQLTLTVLSVCAVLVLLFRLRKRLTLAGALAVLTVFAVLDIAILMVTWFAFTVVDRAASASAITAIVITLAAILLTSRGVVGARATWW